MPTDRESSEQSFLAVAIDTRHGLQYLVDAGAGGHTIHSMGILAGCCLEMALKACLMQSGYGADEVRSYGHNIESLWKDAAMHWNLEEDMPDWARYIAKGHNRPFQYRYPGHQVGVGIKDPETLPDKLEKIIKPLIRNSAHIF